jgi:hypothetical protein
MNAASKKTLKTQAMEELLQPEKELILPKPHIEARLISANETYMLAARGTFKTSRGISLYCIDKIYEMPRSSGVGVGLSYEHLGDNTLPPLLQAWDEFGFVHGEHYVVGKKPPKEWPKPYLGVINEKYDHLISWHNGTVIHLVSLAKKASANGISAQWGFFDEVKFMKEKELQDEIFPVFRGNEKQFKHCGGYLSKFFATDKRADPAMIKWLLGKKALNDDNKNQIVISLQLHLNDLKGQYNAAGKSKKAELKPQINAVEVRLAKLRGNMVHYVEVSGYDVVYAHGERWLKDKQRNMKQNEFEVAIENKDPDKPGESFYPDFDQAIHTYDSTTIDINPMLPFIIASDYQHSVAPIPICQLSKLPGHTTTTLNYVDAVHTLEPQGLQDAVQMFCDKHKTHMRKTVYYIYDHTAIGKRVDADRYCVTVTRTLKANGWHVIEVYTGQAPGHYQKYLDTREWLSIKDGPSQIYINRSRCKKLIISITSSPARTKHDGRTEKDKASEREASLDQSETTHFSDAFDMINHAVLKLKRITANVEARRGGSR